MLFTGVIEFDWLIKLIKHMLLSTYHGLLEFIFFEVCLLELGLKLLLWDSTAWHINHKAIELHAGNGCIFHDLRG